MIRARITPGNSLEWPARPCRLSHDAGRHVKDKGAGMVRSLQWLVRSPAARSVLEVAPAIGARTALSHIDRHRRTERVACASHDHKGWQRCPNPPVGRSTAPCRGQGSPHLQSEAAFATSVASANARAGALRINSSARQTGMRCWCRRQPGNCRARSRRPAVPPGAYCPIWVPRGTDGPSETSALSHLGERPALAAQMARSVQAHAEPNSGTP